MIQEVIGKLISGIDLTQEQASLTMNEIMEDQATSAQIAAFMVGLRFRGETAELLAGMAETMRNKSLRVPVSSPVVDLAGTGGDGLGTFNITTAAAIVTAAANVKVAKHGNRAASGSVGAADILEENGVKLDLTPENVSNCIENIGIGFMFAPSFHPAMRFVAGPRRELGVRTVFNLLGPLTNPAGALHQVIGVASKDLAEKMAVGLKLLGTRYSWIVHSEDGLDEITTTSQTNVWEVQGERIRNYIVSPEDAGLAYANLRDLCPTTKEGYLTMFLNSFSEKHSPEKDVVMLNSAAAFVISGTTPDLRSGVHLARDTINSGAALNKLRELATLTQSLG